MPRNTSESDKAVLSPGEALLVVIGLLVMTVLFLVALAKAGAFS